MNIIAGPFRHARTGVVVDRGYRGGYKKVWGQIDVAPNAYSTLRFGRLVIHVKRVNDEWRFAHTYEEENAEPSDQAPHDEDWIRLISSSDETLELQPALPDRPLVIRPDAPVSIFPGRFARFYVELPLWYRFAAVTKQKRINVIEIPSRILSNTWFGDPASGDLCYSLDAPLRRGSEQLSEPDTTASCSLVVRNDSEEKLDFERICVHVENLSIFEYDEHLWTNELSVLFKGVEQISQISIKDKPPGGLSPAKKITTPREVPNNSILRRSFIFFRQITGI